MKNLIGDILIGVGPMIQVVEGWMKDKKPKAIRRMEMPDELKGKTLYEERSSKRQTVDIYAMDQLEDIIL